jgi:glycerol-3-phosphate acyltransferase PlsY
MVSSERRSAFSSVAEGRIGTARIQTVGTALTVIIAFFLGALSPGAVAGRLAGVDLRAHGSGNLGATNTFRVLGPRYGIPVLIVDVAKGAVAVLFIAPLFAPGSPLGPTGIRTLAALAAVAGHIWSPFISFRGGKGVATAAGAFLALSPFAALAAILLWAVLAVSTRYVSVGSLGASLLLPLAVAVEANLRRTPQPQVIIATAGLLTVVILLRHRGNIARLRRGEENRFERPGRSG